MNSAKCEISFFMNKILITGASGFIGRYVVEKLSLNNQEIIKVDRSLGDIGDETTWTSFPEANIVIHLAGRSFVPDSWIRPEEYFKSNLLGTIGALNYCRKHNARLIFLSSYMYGNVKNMPIPENAELIAKNPYALSKKFCEEACNFYSDNFNIGVTIFRPFNVYGHGQPDDFLIPSILQQIKEGKEIHVKDLKPKRDYVYVEDVVDAIIKSIDYKGEHCLFNIGSGVSHSVHELIDIIQNLMGSYLPVISEELRREGEIMDSIADITRIQTQLQWFPRSLKEGLLKTIQNTILT